MRSIGFDCVTRDQNPTRVRLAFERKWKSKLEARSNSNSQSDSDSHSRLEPKWKLKENQNRNRNRIPNSNSNSKLKAEWKSKFLGSNFVGFERTKLSRTSIGLDSWRGISIHCSSIRLLVCPTVRLSDYPTTRLSDCPTTRMSDYLTVRLSDCPSVCSLTCRRRVESSVRTGDAHNSHDRVRLRPALDSGAS